MLNLLPQKSVVALLFHDQFHCLRHSSILSLPQLSDCNLHCVLFISQRNICHGSDSVTSAQKEISLWFKKDELVDWTPTEQEWIYE